MPVEGGHLNLCKNFIIPDLVYEASDCAWALYAPHFDKVVFPHVHDPYLHGYDHGHRVTALFPHNLPVSASTLSSIVSIYRYVVQLPAISLSRCRQR